MEIGHAKKMRDRRLRQKLLFVLSLSHTTSPSGFVPGRLLVENSAGLMPRGQRFENDEHGLSLVRDLVRAGFAQERELGERRRGQSFGLDFVEYAITDKGTQLLEQTIEPHPLVDDDRHLDE